MYGTVGVGYGELSYTAYVGSRPDDPVGGYEYGVKSFGIELNRTTGRQGGGDLRWSNLVNGLVFGSSFLNSPQDTVGTISMPPLPTSPYAVRGDDNTLTYFAQYKKEKSHSGCRISPRNRHGHDIDYRISYLRSDVSSFAGRARLVCFGCLPRLEKHLELGAYHSWFYPAWQEDHASPAGHIFDQTVTARIDLAKFWDLKVEGHFIDGYGNPQSFRGFYPADNPAGFKQKTNLLVIRTGFNF